MKQKSFRQRILAIVCIAIFMFSYISDYAQVIIADAASVNDAVSANSVLSGNYIDENIEAEDVSEDICIDDEDVCENQIEDWSTVFEFGGTDGTTITNYSGSTGEVVIPAKATSIAENAFDRKKIILTSIKFEEGSKLRSIGNNVFENCTKLSSVQFPATLTTLGDATFKNTALRSIDIPDTVQSIGVQCFANNVWLTSAKIGKGVISIGEYAFSGCDKLRALEINMINDALVGEHVFEGCILKEVNLGKDVICIPARLFAYADFAKKSELIIPKNVEMIGKMAFYKAKNLEVKIEGKKLKHIHVSAFEGSDISSIYMPSSVVEIHESAFKDCKGITEVTIPEDCGRVAPKAFSGCINLSKVTAYRYLYKIGDKAFENCAQNLTFYALKDTYPLQYAAENGFNSVEAYKISYNLGGGINNPANPMLYVPGESRELQIPTRSGFEFEGWHLNSKKGKIITDILDLQGGKAVIYARWTPNEYSVSYILGGDDVDNHVNLKRISRTCKKPFAIGKPKRKGFSFEGWYDNPEFEGKPIKSISTSVDYDVILYAKWKEYTYNVIYNANGGVPTKEATETGALEPLPEMPYSYSFSVPVAGLFESRVEQGYVQTGWNRLPDGTSRNKKGVHYDFGEYTSRMSKKKNADVTIYAEWTPIEYHIEYVLNGGINNKNNPFTHNVEKSVKLRKPKKPGSKFKGWYTDPEFTNKVTKIEKGYPSGITLYAKWD